MLPKSSLEAIGYESDENTMASSLDTNDKHSDRLKIMKIKS